MKFAILIVLMFSSRISKIIMKKNHLPIPESKKLQVQFFRDATSPIHIKSDNQINTIKTNGGYEIVPQTTLFDVP